MVSNLFKRFVGSEPTINSETVSQKADCQSVQPDKVIEMFVIKNGKISGKVVL